MNIHLDEKELEIIVDLLARELKELPTEIRHTSTREYREMLKEREEGLRKLAVRLESALPGDLGRETSEWAPMM
ncbi:MAG: hypothetical protein EHM32_08695 [Spirochaetales bacterium]|nr:MAG: hypothetical protein EHM32_08695 [Spirochaetales bacterium]